MPAKTRPRARNTGPTPAVRQAVYARDMTRCVRCGSAVTLTVQHRVNRAMGGSSDPAINSPANLLTACQACNMAFEARPTEAYRFGWKVRRPTDPATVPVWTTLGGWMLMGHDGTATKIQAPDGFRR